MKGALQSQDEPHGTTSGQNSYNEASLATLIESAADLVGSNIGQEFASQADDLRKLLERLNEQRFHLAVLGQFKRGKSTLLNALLGEEILPSSVIPLTAIPTFILAGEKRKARIFFSNDRPYVEKESLDASELNSFLSQYVAEESNPSNQLNVAYVEVTHPASILRKGAVLIDTPGIGSTHRHNTEATLNFIPQCDAAILVVSPDPPITEVEIEFLKEVRTRISRIFYVLNKADYLSEQDKNKILDFLRSVIQAQEKVQDDINIIPVSAKLGLAARLEDSKEGWTKSGMDVLERFLIEFLAYEKEKALAEAIAKKASDIIGTVLLEMRLSLQSLKLPINELEARLNSLENKLAEANLQRIAEGDTLEGDKKRMIAFLEEQAEQLRKKAKKRFMQVATDALEQNHLDTEAAQNALADVIPEFFEHELGELSRVFEAQVREVLNRHQQRANDLIESIHKTAAEMFDIHYQPPASKEEFEIKKQPYWTTHHWPVSIGILPEDFWDRLLPYRIRKSRAFSRMRERIEVLVAENVENVRWPTLQNLQKSFREFSENLDNRIERAILATKGAIENIYKMRREQEETVKSESARLENEMAKLEKINKMLLSYCNTANNGECGQFASEDRFSLPK